MPVDPEKLKLIRLTFCSKVALPVFRTTGRIDLCEKAWSSFIDMLSKDEYITQSEGQELEADPPVIMLVHVKPDHVDIRGMAKAARKTSEEVN